SDLFEHIYWGNEAFDRTEFVNHHDQLSTRRLQNVDEIQHTHRLVNNNGRAQTLLIDLAIHNEVSNQVFGATDTNNFIQRTAAHRVKTMWCAVNLGAQRVGIAIQV